MCRHKVKVFPIFCVLSSTMYANERYLQKCYILPAVVLHAACLERMNDASK